ncbi:MFS transporter [Modestobacter sp. Leaf380]|uniref:MFS transporter n=1 Tax=Modestobacter sp. Leaf380 TaxID=1736356 RepID=UPI0009E8E3F6|nr:MFS transporter [Modestobacter sp. Leaf380]
MATWVVRTPTVRDALDASTGEMGWVLAGLSGGSMAGILASGRLVARFGARRIIAGGTAAVLAGLVLVGVGTGLGSAVVVTAGLAVLGAGIGGGDVAMNVEGAAIEHLSGRPFLPVLHGWFSLGTVVGAVIGLGAAALGLPMVWHALGLAVVGVAGAVAVIDWVSAESGRRPAGAQVEQRRASGVRRWRDRRLLVVCICVVGVALAEGAANDWLPLLVIDGHGFPDAWGSGVYVIFAAAMATGRFGGGWVVNRVGPARALVLSGLTAATGVALVVLVDQDAIVVGAVVLWGLGSALGFPVVLSAAGRTGPDFAARVAAVSTVGFTAFLVGPPVLGLVGEDSGLRAAMLVPLAFILVSTALAPALTRVAPMSAGRGVAADRDPSSDWPWLCRSCATMNEPRRRRCRDCRTRRESVGGR